MSTDLCSVLTPRQGWSFPSCRWVFRWGLGWESHLSTLITLAVNTEAGVYNAIDDPHRYKVSVRISGFGEINKTD